MLPLSTTRGPHFNISRQKTEQCLHATLTTSHDTVYLTHAHIIIVHVSVTADVFGNVIAATNNKLKPKLSAFICCLEVPEWARITQNGVAPGNRGCSRFSSLVSENVTPHLLPKFKGAHISMNGVESNHRRCN